MTFWQCKIKRHHLVNRKLEDLFYIVISCHGRKKTFNRTLWDIYIVMLLSRNILPCRSLLAASEEAYNNKVSNGPFWSLLSVCRGHYYFLIVNVSRQKNAFYLFNRLFAKTSKYISVSLILRLLADQKEKRQNLLLSRCFGSTSMFLLPQTP